MCKGYVRTATQAAYMMNLYREARCLVASKSETKLQLKCSNTIKTADTLLRSPCAAVNKFAYESSNPLS